jgi:SH3 domain protein
MGGSEVCEPALVRLLAGAWLLVAFLGPASARAETAWVKGEIQLNLRSGPSTGNRILTSVTTGDQVTVLERGESWTQVRTAGGEEGWIPAGYLAAEAPPGVRVTQLEREVSELRRRLGEADSQLETLRTQNETFSSRDEEQEASLRELTEENLDLKAGARWPYLITGAVILTVGMLFGAILARGAGRRRTRIRL